MHGIEFVLEVGLYLVKRVAHVRPISEVVVSSLPGRQTVEAPVQVLQQPNDHLQLALKDLPLSPRELLAHLVLSSENLKTLPDVGEHGGLSLGVFENARDLQIKHSLH